MENPIADDGLKWFGEGFDGFPKRLPDDCVEYSMHVVCTEPTSVATTRSKLNEVLTAANRLKKQYLKDYIWQRDGFELSIHPKVDLVAGDASTTPQDYRAQPYLQGRTDFGDSVADEWLVVYLLLELTKQFSDVWVRVYDTDGEFLLIEAAKALPKWLNPEIAENRVWLNQGHLKMIPMTKDDTSRNLSMLDALDTIEQANDILLTDSAVEKEAFYRLREYPSAIPSSLHHSLITIPRRLLYVLHRNPAYISPAIESFYLRDPISLRPLASKDLSTLHFAPEDFVTASVKFTRVGFAQLRSQVFDAPPAWTGITPRLHDEKVTMGMKLTCGFEMLVDDPHNQDKRVVREINILLGDTESGDESLPSNDEIATWPKLQDDEKWLDIDYNDFEKELSGKASSGKTDEEGGFGDQGTQDNLRKMVSRFQDFLEDDDAGAEGVDDLDEDEDASSDASSESGEGSGTIEGDETDYTHFERSMKEVRLMPETHLEEKGLLEEARRLALQDDEDADDVDEEEELRKVMELMEKELKGHGALDVDGKGSGKRKAPISKSTVESKAASKPFFGPERPPHMQTAVSKSGGQVQVEDDNEEIGPGDGELSSDDEDFNDVDLGLAKNMLESFKGQAGMAGPAGNLMKALGVSMPRDEDSD